MMGRSARPNEKRKKQKSKNKGRDYEVFPVNEMSDKRFERGDKDGGYDNWIPFQDRNIPVDKTQLLNTNNMKVLLPKQTKKKRY